MPLVPFKKAKKSKKTHPVPLTPSLRQTVRAPIDPIKFCPTISCRFKDKLEENTGTWDDVILQKKTSRRVPSFPGIAGLRLSPLDFVTITDR